MHSSDPIAVSASRARALRRQRGVVLILTLIILALLMIAGVALIRSFDTSILLSGNIGFKRDLVNQSELGIAQILARFKSGGAMASDTTRQSNQAAYNYSACVLPTNAMGIPTILLQGDSDFAGTAYVNQGAADANCTSAVASSANDITTGNALFNSGVTIRYVIDRLCTATGAEGKTNCAINSIGSDSGGTSFLKKAGGQSLPVYRISLKVTGPRNTQTFVQTTFSM